MSDISKCTGFGCPIRDTCWRWRAPASEFRQAYIALRYEVGCTYHLPIRQVTPRVPKRRPIRRSVGGL